MIGACVLGVALFAIPLAIDLAHSVHRDHGGEPPGRPAGRRAPARAGSSLGPGPAGSMAPPAAAPTRRRSRPAALGAGRAQTVGLPIAAPLRALKASSICSTLLSLAASTSALYLSFSVARCSR